jgi:hypothetical protein
MRQDEELPGVPVVGFSAGGVITFDAPVLTDEFLVRHGTTFVDPTLRLQGEWVFAQQETMRYIGQIRAFLSRCPQDGRCSSRMPGSSRCLIFRLQAALA